MAFVELLAGNRDVMLKSLKNKKFVLLLGLVLACIMCAVDLKLIDGIVFQFAQVISSTAAVVIKLAAVLVRS